MNDTLPLYRVSNLPLWAADAALTPARPDGYAHRVSFSRAYTLLNVCHFASSVVL